MNTNGIFRNGWKNVEIRGGSTSIGDAGLNCKKNAPASCSLTGAALQEPHMCGSWLYGSCAFAGRWKAGHAWPLHAKRYYRFVYPISFSSTTAAVSRPSRSAQTTRLWPRRISPQANTFGAAVAYFTSATVPRFVRSTPNASAT